MAYRCLRDVRSCGWERSNKPIACESCLGDNPYVKMTKSDYGMECKICTRPFTVFRWRPGRAARYKKTEICQTCSNLKNVCQVCILDLQYGLPVQVRDFDLHSPFNNVIPKSDVNREYFAEEHDRQVRTGIDYESSFGKVPASYTIMKLQRTSPYYKRNRPHVCSFYIRGACTRGIKCCFRHEMPETGELSRQNIKDRYFGVNDPVAMKLLRKAEKMPSLEPPEDPLIRTLYVGGLDASLTEQDLREHFNAYGEIQGVNIVSKLACAFVAYKSRESAEKAAEDLSNKLVVKGLRLKLKWAQCKAQRTVGECSEGSVQSQLQPPPGVQNLPPTMHNHFYYAQEKFAYYLSMDPQRMGAHPPPLHQ